MDSLKLLFSFLLATTAFYGLTLAVVLTVRKNYQPRANRTLALIVGGISLLLLQYSITRSGVYPQFIRFSPIIGATWYVIPGLIFIHATFLIKPKAKPNIVWLLHLVPLVIYAINVLPFYIQLDARQQMNWIAEGGQGNWLNELMRSGFVLLATFLVYLPSTIWKLNRFISINKKSLSNSGINRIIYTRNCYVLFTLIAVTMEMLVVLKVPGNWYIIVLLSFVVVIFSLAYLSMARPSTLFSQAPFSWSFRSRNLPEDELELYSSLLIEQMANRLYRDPELSLNKLAVLLKLQPRQLTGLIKTKFGRSFPDFVNQYRVDEAEQLLVDPKFKHWSILAIGLEVGFNSKSTFNRAFKKINGQTPSQYQESLNEAESYQL